MAFTTHPAPASFGATLRGLIAIPARAVAGVFDSLIRAVEMNATVHQRLAEAERLQAKSDAELAEMGLNRHDIAHHVFRDMLWT